MTRPFGRLFVALASLALLFAPAISAEAASVTFGSSSVEPGATISATITLSSGETVWGACLTTSTCRNKTNIMTSGAGAAGPGTVNAIITIPASTTPGSHTVRVTILNPVSGFNQPITVVAPPTTTTTTTIAPTTTTTTTATTTTTTASVATTAPTTTTTTAKSTPTSAAPTTSTSTPGPATSAPPATAAPTTTGPKIGTTIAAGSDTTTDGSSTSRLSIQLASRAEPQTNTIVIGKRPTSEPRGGVGTWLWAMAVVVIVAGAIAAMRRWIAGAKRRRRDVPDQRTATQVPPVEESAWDVGTLDIETGIGLHAVRRVGSTCVAMGTTRLDQGRGQARIWTTADGKRWRIHQGWGEGLVADCLEHDGKYLAVGYLFDDKGVAHGTAWIAGAEQNWQPLTTVDDPTLTGVSFERVVEVGSTLYAMARDGEGTWLFRSNDARNWDRIDLGGIVSSVHEIAGTAVVIGRWIDEHRSMIQRSDDDGGFAEMPPDLRFPLEMALVEDACAFDGGFVAVGQDRAESRATVLVSDDGDHWVKVPVDFEAGSAIEQVVATDLGLVALGTLTRGLGLWTSIDSVAWHPVEDPAFKGAIPVGMGWFDDTLRIIGGRTQDETLQLATWSSPLAPLFVVPEDAPVEPVGSVG